MRTLSRLAYRGVRVGGDPSVLGTDGRCLEPFRLVGGALGWGGDGPESSRTAAAILADHLRGAQGLPGADANRVVICLATRFKREVVALLPDEWLVSPRVIEEFRGMVEREAAGLPVSWPLWRASCYERELLVAVSGRPSLRP